MNKTDYLVKVLVTTGPSYEPIDEVRRLTNFSTGELGIQLSNLLAKAGYQVICLKGVAATCCAPLVDVEHQPFATNHDLLVRLTSLGQEHDVGAVFHVAALCDYTVKHVADRNGEKLREAKVDSRKGDLVVLLEPALKIIGHLRSLFPQASIVGWKYELNGHQPEALAKAWRQLRENQTDACVLNGRAWGPGFGFCVPPDIVQVLSDKAAVSSYLVQWLIGRLPPASS